MTPRNETNDGRLTDLMTTVLLAAAAPASDKTTEPRPRCHWLNSA